jgi:hypothetical protein
MSMQREPTKLPGTESMQGHGLSENDALQLIVALSRFCVAQRRRSEARRSEKDGFRLSAAMQWRHAAELFDPELNLSDRCWREWERVTMLRRELAAPIGDD